MSFLKDLIECKTCQKTIKHPVILPCGHSICKHHAHEASDADTKENKQMKCVICDESYDIPLGGFARNRVLEEFLIRDIESLDLGEEYNSAREKCAQFGDLLDKFKRMKNDPEMRIHTVISELRNKVDVRREELKSEIDKKSLAIIQKLDEFEKECKSSIKSDASLNEKLEKWDNDLKQWKQSLNTFKKDIKKWKEISNISILQLKELQSELIDFNKNLFLNLLKERSTAVLALSDFITITLEVKYLSSFKEIKEQTQIIYHKMKAGGIEWRLSVNIGQYEEEKKETYIGVFLGAAQDVSVRYDLLILSQFDMDEQIKKISFYRKLDSYEGYGAVMIKLKDLLNNYNLYNFKKDSIIVQAIIKKIEWL